MKKVTLLMEDKGRNGILILALPGHGTCIRRWFLQKPKAIISLCHQENFDLPDEGFLIEEFINLVFECMKKNMIHILMNQNILSSSQQSQFKSKWRTKKGKAEKNCCQVLGVRPLKTFSKNLQNPRNRGSFIPYNK